ncbi:hypothetical protein EJ04DRAFT_22703 [Polyplosphaeria fusca]|uniref:Uncharacterized protein n=1 Tax=Polyplosphaeria fusca TaxID=682080 RepID=A0A9P4V3N7_9PLEO|nr:hypothetical protein EJ04DRAFT_22703 [Polyplosphaeria fusca]
MYVHIRAKFGEPVMEDWEITWQMNEDVGPIIQAENKKLGKAFGMAPPITGFYDHKSELRKLRSDRDAGEIYEVPENLKAFVVDENTPSIKAAAKLSPALRPATDASVPGSSPSALDLSATTADHVALSTQAITSNTGAFASLSGPSLEKRAHKREKFGETDIIEASGIDDEDWGLMFHGDTELYGDEDDDVMDYEEAKECARGNEGYVYKREDAKQAKRKGWLW